MEVSDVSREKLPFSNDICETCLRDNDLIDITNEFHKDIPFVIMLEQYISPEFYSTPKCMCKYCIGELTKFNDFIENCKKNILLYETLKNKSYNIVNENICINQNCEALKNNENQNICENQNCEIESNLNTFLIEKNLNDIPTKEISNANNIEKELNANETNNIEYDTKIIEGEINEINIQVDNNYEDKLINTENVMQKVDVTKGNVVKQTSVKNREKAEQVSINQPNISNQGNATYRKYSSSNEILEKTSSTTRGKINLKPLELGMNAKHRPWNSFDRNRKLSSSIVINKSTNNEEYQRKYTEKSKGKKIKNYKHASINNSNVFNSNMDSVEAIYRNKNEDCTAKSVQENTQQIIESNILCNSYEKNLDCTEFDNNTSGAFENDELIKNKMKRKNKRKINSFREKHGITNYEKPQQNVFPGKQCSSNVDRKNHTERNINDLSNNVNIEASLILPATEELRNVIKSPNPSFSKGSHNISKLPQNNNSKSSKESGDNMGSSKFRNANNKISSGLPVSKETGNDMQLSTAYKERRNTRTRSIENNSQVKSSTSNNNSTSSRIINKKSTRTSTYESRNSIKVSTEVTETKSEFTISESTKKTQDWLFQSVHAEDYKSDDFQRTSSSSFSNEEDRKRVASTSTYRSDDVDDFDGMSVTKSEINFENYRTGYEYKCDYCPCSFMLVSSLAHHKKVHGLTIISKPYLCEYCGETFMNFSKFRTHRKDHSLEQPYICLYCEKVVRGPHIYNNHIRYHTVEMGELSTTDKFDVISKLIHRGKFACGFCGKLFGNKKVLQTHLFWHPDEAKLFGCNYCDKTFTQKRSLRNHELLHKEEKNFDKAKGKPNTC